MICDKTTLELRSSPIVGRIAAAPRLNPVFCRERGVALIKWDGDAALVGMIDPGDPETLAALRFAIGCAITPVAMMRAEVDRHNEAERSDLRAASAMPAAGSAAALDPHLPNRAGPSLSEIARQRVIAKMGVAASLAPFEPLLRAGLALPEAGAALLAAHATGQQLAPNTLALAVMARDQTGVFGEVAGGAALIPGWIVSALSSMPAGTNPAPLLANLLEVERTLGLRRTDLIRLAVEIATAGVLVVAVWLPLSVVMALVLALCAATALYWLAGGKPRFALVRIAVLKLVGALKRNDVSSAAAISIALERLQEDAPTWGRLPDTREELSNALRLDPLTAATLQHGALEIGARCASEICAEREDNALAAVRWIARLGAVSAFGVAILLHLA